MSGAHHLNMSLNPSNPRISSRANPLETGLGWSEEYYPYGSTAWRAPELATISKKRYRFTGMERDEESGLQCHGRRYYAPWLGRWTSADPIGLKDGVNRYEYCHGAPHGSRDPSGLAPQDGAPHPDGAEGHPGRPPAPTDQELIDAALVRIGTVLDQAVTDTQAELVRLESLKTSPPNSGLTDADRAGIDADMDKAKYVIEHLLTMENSLRLVTEGKVDISVADLNSKSRWFEYKSGKVSEDASGVHIALDSRLVRGTLPRGRDDLDTALVHELSHAADHLAAGGEKYAEANATVTASEERLNAHSGESLSAQANSFGRAMIEDTMAAYGTKIETEKRASENATLFNAFRGIGPSNSGSISNYTDRMDVWSGMLKHL